MVKANMITRRNIQYPITGSWRYPIIPSGTPVIEATNLPIELHDNVKRYWVEPWVGMSEIEKSWHRNYGFLIDAVDVVKKGEEI